MTAGEVVWVRMEVGRAGARGAVAKGMNLVERGILEDRWCWVVT